MAKDKQNNLKGSGAAKADAGKPRSSSLEARLATVSSATVGNTAVSLPPPLPIPTGEFNPGETKDVSDSPMTNSVSAAAAKSETSLPKNSPSEGDDAPAKPPLPPPLQDAPDASSSAAPKREDPETAPRRRAARRRPAGPVRGRMAANDDAPSIGGLIFALQQTPSSKPFKYATIASVVWVVLGTAFLWLTLSADLDQGETLLRVLSKPTTFLMLTAVAVPIAVIWFLALLAWRSEELRLRSSTMAEVAVRLAEPDRMAEQSVASLGQAVRRQVSFMNDAVSRALGRAGELEALVHNEVTALERSYEENEQKIRGLINELSSERGALVRTGDDFAVTLRALGSEVPALIESLSAQQTKLASIIQGAGENLTSLESSLAQSAGKLETSLGARAEEVKGVIGQYTTALDSALTSRTEQLQEVLAEHSKELGATLGTRSEEIRGALEHHTDKLGSTLGDTSQKMQGMLEDYTAGLAAALGSRTEQMQQAFDDYMSSLDESIATRTDNLQAVFEEYARALDTTLSNRAQALDTQLVQRTRALDNAFNERLRLFDESVMRSTSAIDEAVGERAHALTTALDAHAKTFRETISRQSADFDDSLAQGINAVRRSSENITRQSLKAIEGLANQSDLLKNVSENLLGQINTVTNRFENQGQSIMRAANALESANHKIDSTLQLRHTELSDTLDRLSGKADEFSNFIEGYSTTLVGSLNEADARARETAEQLRKGTETQQRAAMEDIRRFKAEADAESTRALQDLRKRFSTVSREVTSHLGNLSTQFDVSSEKLRERAQQATQAIEEEQARLQAELASIPTSTKESAEAMRRALQDQLRALEQLSQLTTREASQRDVSTPQNAARPGEAGGERRLASERQLSSLTSSLAREMQSQVQTAHTPAQGHSQQPGGPARQGGGTNLPVATGSSPSQYDAGGDRWALGDLLKRASVEEEASAPHEAAPVAPRSGPVLPDVELMVHAIDPATASAVWQRLRAGQRGIMVPSMYNGAARSAFDELSRRYHSDAELQQAVSRFLVDFERTLRDAEQRDPSGRLLQSHLVSEMGRVYLFLGHASGRLG
ncbi:Apolipoprotein A1/A4/E domain-containing protein [Filomicrobium insigne]|uniref:Apolipoprotein A1/A4/E domain-containing protein n=1 Tax=Filomicrobium insigne TaxID=418854 RepID=A0A1H0R9Q6_9HYPH|nr:apolipoprotein A1/A4/E domain-containing protein [Filomicrobium insigne]SDP26234.1 Apolipoprotein A1/A4/E domain-containing protein [Filomicrobium insigne]